MQANPHYANMEFIPPYSCRSGLSVLMARSDRLCLDAVPVKREIERRVANVRPDLDFAVWPN